MHSYLSHQKQYDMRYSNILTIIILTWFAQLATAQEAISTNRKELTIGIGISKVSILDNRYSAKTFSFIQPSYHIGYKWQNNDTRQSIVLDFKMNQKYDKTKILDLSFIMPTMGYSLQKRSGDLWIGGSIKSATILNFPRSKTGHFNNSPISYTFANSIGPKISYTYTPEDSRFSIDTDVETAFLGYVIRPAYGHPYPSRFLDSGRFTPTREGMTGPLLGSGKIMTLGKFNSIKLVLGLSYMVNDNIKFGLNMTVDHISVSDINQLSSTSADILFTTSYVY